MPGTLRHITPAPPSRLARLYARLSTTPLAMLISRRVSWKLDLVLLRASKGRVSSTVFFPSAVLETTGARSGRQRRNAVIYFHDGDVATIVASHAGAPTHPGWFHNLGAHPDVVFGGVPMRASIVGPGDRDRLWALADMVFPAYATYRADAAKTGREIPIVQLTER